MDDRLIGRAGFLGLVGAGIAGLFYGRDALNALERMTPSSVRSLVPTGGWRIYTIGNGLPKVDRATFRLTIGGHVEKPLTLTLADLRAFPRARQVSDFHCVTGWSVQNVHWEGVRFRDLLAEARPKPGARSLQFTSIEPDYQDSLTLDQALLPDVLLAFGMDGGPLPRPHGAPLRVVMPRMYGYKSVKWVGRIDVRPDVETGFWEQHGYDADAWIGNSNGF